MTKERKIAGRDVPKDFGAVHGQAGKEPPAGYQPEVDPEGSPAVEAEGETATKKAAKPAKGGGE